MNKLKFAVVGILLAAAAIALVIQNQAQVKLRAENESLRQQLDQLARLQADNETLSNSLARATAALASSRNVPPAQPPPEPAAKTNAPDNAATVANPTDLGVIQLVNQTPSRFDLGEGRTCTLTPTIDADGNYNIKVAFESKKMAGQTAQLETTSAEVVTSPGRAVAIEAGGNIIAFTPTVNPAP